MFCSPTRQNSRSSDSLLAFQGLRRLVLAQAMLQSRPLRCPIRIVKGPVQLNAHTQSRGPRGGLPLAIRRGHRGGVCASPSGMLGDAPSRQSSPGPPVSAGKDGARDAAGVSSLQELLLRCILYVNSRGIRVEGSTHPSRQPAAGAPHWSSSKLGLRMLPLQLHRKGLCTTRTLSTKICQDPSRSPGSPMFW